MNDVRTVTESEDEVKPLHESIVSRIGFWQGLVVSAISIATTIAVLSVFFTGALNRLQQVESKQAQAEIQLEKLRNELNERLLRIEEKMVNKEDFRELKTDVKELIRRK